MNPNVDFEVLSWHEEFIVKEIRIFGIGPDGAVLELTRSYSYADFVDVKTIRETVAKINNGTYRRN